MTTSTEWQLGMGTAERYEQILTPVILGPFARALVDFAGVGLGERVLDVGCGTGAAARYAAELTGPSGWTMGLDVNEGMIAVAESITAESQPTIEWRVADAADLPIADGDVDIVLCAQSLQFMRDKDRVLSEMGRAAGQDGLVALSLWTGKEENPYFQTLIEAVGRHINWETAVGLDAIFALSDKDEIERLAKTAGFRQIDISVTQLDLPMPTLSEFVPRHITATPMAAGYTAASQKAQQAVVGAVVKALTRVGLNGRMKIPFRSYMVLCRK